MVEVACDFRVLEARGERMLPDMPLLKALGATERQAQQLRQLLPLHSRVLWAVGETPLLIFTDWLAVTGLIFVVLPHCSAAAVFRALEAYPRAQFAVFQPLPLLRASVGEIREAAEILSDIFVYTDVIFSPPWQNPRQRLAYIAAFSGCYLVRGVEKQTFRSEDAWLVGARTAAFLQCAFLHLRRQIGYRCEETVHQISFVSEPRGEEVHPAFLQTPCFSSLSISIEGNALTLSLRELQSKSGVFASSALGDCHVFLRILSFVS